jgi:RNA polymerase sigma factor (sigma-70 family)
VEVQTLKHLGADGLRGPTPLLRLQGDERLVALTRRGNQAAYEALVARYQSRLLAFCRHMLSSREDAEDVLQEVFAAAFNAMMADERPLNVRPWLYRIARNRSLNHLRRTQAVGVDSMDVHFADNGQTTADKAHRREDFRLLVADVQELPETQRTALLLREIDALSYEQIAEAMETTVPSIKSLLVRARVSLAEAAEARHLTCVDVRIELGEVAEGLRRTSAPVRRHVRSCERCSAFRKQLKDTNRALAMVFPAAPLLLLKKLFLAHLGTTASAGGASAAASAAGATAASAGAGGAISAGLSTAASKAAAGLAAAALVTAGAVEVDHARHDRAATAPPVASAVASPPVREPVVVATQPQPSAPAAAAKPAAEKPAAKERGRDRRAATPAAEPAAAESATGGLAPAAAAGGRRPIVVAPPAPQHGSDTTVLPALQPGVIDPNGGVVGIGEPPDTSVPAPPAPPEPAAPVTAADAQPADPAPPEPAPAAEPAPPAATGPAPAVPTGRTLVKPADPASPAPPAKPTPPVEPLPPAEPGAAPAPLAPLAPQPTRSPGTAPGSGASSSTPSSL